MNRAAEDYIKTIYILKMKVSCVHSVDVARELGFSKASVSRAVTNLRESKIINVRHDGEIVFTSKGKKIAEAIYEKHLVLSKFLKMVADIDEKTARVDADNERAIQEAISELCRDKTLLVIAHRLNTIEDADQICVIENGRISEHGNHDSLMREKGCYYNMVSKRTA